MTSHISCIASGPQFNFAVYSSLRSVWCLVKKHIFFSLFVFVPHGEVYNIVFFLYAPSDALLSACATGKKEMGVCLCQ